MEKRIGAFEARRQLGKVLQEVVANGDRYLVERHGEPVAAVVPIEVYRQWKDARKAFFERIAQASEHSGLTPEEAENLAGETITQVRGTSTR